MEIIGWIIIFFLPVSAIGLVLFCKIRTKFIAGGFILACMLIIGSMILNMNDYSNVIPQSLRGIHTFFGGPIAAILVQIASLIIALRGATKKKIIVLFWCGLFVLFLALLLFTAFITIASGFA